VSGWRAGARPGGEMRGSDANWTKVGDGPDRRDLAVGEIDMEEGVGPAQEKRAERRS
jgi:hypothetical protein